MMILSVAVRARRFDRLALRTLREAQDLTQPQLADKAGIPLDTYRDYEQGRSNPSVPRLMRLADALGCSLDDLATTRGM